MDALFKKSTDRHCESSLSLVKWTSQTIIRAIHIHPKTSVLRQPAHL